jgi:hypothetical protein
MLLVGYSRRRSLDCAQSSGGVSGSRYATRCNRQPGRTIMPLRFLAIDPDTNGENCPAVFADEKTGDLLFQGQAVTDAAALAEAGTYSPLGDGESVVRLPARMRAVIMEALNAQDAVVRRADSGGDDLSGAPGDPRRLHP